MNQDRETGGWGLLARIGLVLGIVASLVTAVGFLRQLSTPTSTNASTSGPGVQNPGNPAHGTATATVALHPAATSTPKPVAPGATICAGGGSQGWNGWPATGSWHVVGNNLVNDGSDGSGGLAPNLIAPDQCQPTTPNYSVIATIKLDRFGYNYGFGLDARGQTTSNGWTGYAAWLYTCTQGVNCTEARISAATGYGDGTDLSTVSYYLDQSFHTYEIQVQGNLITFKIDGASVASQTDNEYLSPGQVGLMCKARNQIEVSSVQVVAR